MKKMMLVAFVLALALMAGACGGQSPVGPTGPDVPALRVETSPMYCNVGTYQIPFTIPSSRMVDRVVVRTTGGEGTLLVYVEALEGSTYVKVVSSELKSPGGEAKFEGVVIPRNPSNPIPTFVVGVSNISHTPGMCVTVEITHV